jgi:serine protease Do
VLHGKHVEVVLADGRETSCEIVESAPDLDLALLHVDAPGLAPVRFRDSRSLCAGDVVIAVGNPLGLVGAVTMGIVHSADAAGDRVVADLLLLPGNSGGPLADANGDVVGVNAMVVDGLAVAISGNVVTRFLASPGRRARIGVVTQPVRITVMGEQRLGLLVLELQRRGPADRSGVLIGDVVIGVDGRLIDAPSDLGRSIDDAGVGARLRLDMVRAGRVIGVDVEVGNAPASRKHAA